MAETQATQQTTMVCAKSFSANGIAYTDHQEIPPAEYSAWPSGAVANRLNNGYITYRTQVVPAADSGTTDTSAAPGGAGGTRTLPEEAKSSKAALEAFLREAKVEVEGFDLRMGLDKLVELVEAHLSKTATPS